MLGETVSRLKGFLPPENILVVTGRRHHRQVRAALPELPAASILGEPVGRNTAACIAWATLEVQRRCPDAVMSVLSADHRIANRKAFLGDLAQAYLVADQFGRLVTFGIPPTSPATGYGYVRMGAAIREAGGAREVAAFVEKPNLSKAKTYVSSGQYLWNSGMFAWRTDVIWEELEKYLPSLAADLLAMDAKRRRGAIPTPVLDRGYPRLESVSIDYGVLERSKRVAVLPASFDWTDVGSWDAAGALWPLDDKGNASRDPLLALDASGNVVASRGKPVVLLGVQDLVVVDAGDALLVCARDRCQDVRAVVGALDAAGLGKLR